nr:uncharacterized protein CTRU02_05468 [Colletotrichum truncatum]KAF6793911.1 hypothetical protein CTRU02_05468 [Colletotrichum truncatum]
MPIWFTATAIFKQLCRSLIVAILLSSFVLLLIGGNWMIFLYQPSVEAQDAKSARDDSLEAFGANRNDYNGLPVSEDFRKKMQEIRTTVLDLYDTRKEPVIKEHLQIIKDDVEKLLCELEQDKYSIKLSFQKQLLTNPIAD